MISILSKHSQHRDRNYCLYKLWKRLSIMPTACHEQSFRQFRHAPLPAQNKLVKEINSHSARISCTMIKTGDAPAWAEDMVCNETRLNGHSNASFDQQIERMMCAADNHIRPMLSKPAAHR